MMMDKERFLKTGLLEQYVLGLADEEEALEVERYASAYPEIQQEIDALREAMDEYAGQYVQMPAAKLKALAGQPSGTKHASKELASSGDARMGWFRAIVLGLVAVLSFLSLSLFNGKSVAEQNYQRLDAEFQTLKTDCARREAALQAYAFLADAGTHPVALKGLGPAPEAYAVVFWNDKEQLAYLNPAGLPLPPEGKTYQLWADVEGKMIDMGLVDMRRTELQPVRFIEGAEALNITIEPEGGSEEPTVSLLCANGEV